MGKLSIPLSAIPDNGITVDVQVPVTEVRPHEADELPVIHIAVQGTLSKVGEDYYFDGVVMGDFAQPCDRCLDEVTIHEEVEASWTFRTGAPAEVIVDQMDSEMEEPDALLYPIEGGEIDLVPRVWEELVLAAPVKYLCHPDCVGLCPHCGANLNRDMCACPKEEIETMGNTGLAGLGDLFPRLKRQPPKE